LTGAGGKRWRRNSSSVLTPEEVCGKMKKSIKPGAYLSVFGRKFISRYRNTRRIEN